AKSLKISKIFAPLKNINMNVNEGEFISISGPNGSGKTSLLKVMSGLMKPFSGEVKWKVKNFGFVSQSQVLLPELTLMENILLPFYLANEKHVNNHYSFQKTDFPTIIERMKSYVRRFNIQDILEKKPGTCSVGQQQRALLVRALALDCDVIFADEPEQNLDSDGRIELFESFKEVNNDYNKTIVLVTQEHPNVLKNYVTRGIKIKNSTIEEIL
ncbi:MAG: ABC transporter ATP-binding protein, partial [Promethearchaeota archaeon]